MYIEIGHENKNCLPLPQERYRIQEYPNDVRLRKTGSALLKVMSGLMKSAGDSVIAVRLRTVAFSCQQACKQTDV